MVIKKQFMPIIEQGSFTARGWKEHYSGFPADLFYTGTKSDNPWAVKPHLHLNYAMGGSLQSLTYKDDAGQNHYIYICGGTGTKGQRAFPPRQFWAR